MKQLKAPRTGSTGSTGSTSFLQFLTPAGNLRLGVDDHQDWMTETFMILNPGSNPFGPTVSEIAEFEILARIEVLAPIADPVQVTQITFWEIALLERIFGIPVDDLKADARYDVLQKHALSMIQFFRNALENIRARAAGLEPIHPPVPTFKSTGTHGEN